MPSFFTEVDHPIVGLIDDHEVMQVVLWIGDLLDPAVPISCTVEDFRRGGKTSVWGIGTVQGDLDLCQHFWRFLSQ